MGKSSKWQQIKAMITHNKRWILLSILIVIFIIIAREVFKSQLFVSDFVIYDFLVEHRNNFLTGLFKTVTHFGGAIILVSVTILCIVFVPQKKYKCVIPFNLGFIVLLNVILKNFFERPRPNHLRIIEEVGFSFPSGHSMASMAFYGYLAYLVFKYVKNKKIRNIVCILIGIMILLIGFSRIYLGVHYTSDVIAGFCFSMAYLIFMISSGIY